MYTMSDFEPKLSVLRIRAKYAAPYKKHMYFYLHKEDLESQKAFEEKVNKTVRNWKDGDYYLKLSSGRVFVRLTIIEGKLEKIHKTSPITKKEYPISKFLKK